MNAKTAARCMFIAVIFGSAVAQAQSDQAPPPPILATYEGQVFNGDDMDSILTTFSIEDGKQLSGTYVVEEETGMETGKLSDCKLEGAYTVTCTWQDKYGTGFARILFSADYRSFSGYWGQSSETTFLPWNGVRKESSEK